MREIDEVDFVLGFNLVQNEVHETSVEKGWWEFEDDIEKYGLPPDVQNRIITAINAEKIALIHSEASEVLEGLRHKNPPDDKIPEFLASEAECADIIIRIMDLAARRKWRVAEAIVAKKEMNKCRPLMHGGKSF